MVGRLLLVSMMIMLAPLPTSAQIYRGESTTQDANEGTPFLSQEETAVETAEEPEAEYAPAFETHLGEILISTHFSQSYRLSMVDDFMVDLDRNPYDSETYNEFQSDPAFNTQFRVGGVLDSGSYTDILRVRLVYEHDLATGLFIGGRSSSEGVVDQFMPLSGESETVLRKAHLRIDAGEDIHFLAGYTTSHWGLGLLANDGAHTPTLGSAQFSDPRDGDRVLRAMGLVGPATDMGLVIGLGLDQVEDDDATLDGDSARQLVAILSLGMGQPTHIGAYTAIRRQTDEDGATLDVQVIDVEGQYTLDLEDNRSLTLAGEGAYIWGETSFGPSTDFPIHTVQQLGIACRANLDLGSYGFAFDGLYASGDDNPYDETQTAFKADRNYPMGQLLFPVVNAAISAQSTFHDPDNSGVPPEDLDRLPTRGAVSNTIALFPRGYWQPVPDLEIYGGALFALSAADVIDPFNTTTGGASRNTFDAEPGGYLGTELDLGMRYQTVISGSELTLSLESAAFLPGSAFSMGSGGEVLEPVLGGRVIARYRF